VGRHHRVTPGKLADPGVGSRHGAVPLLQVVEVAAGEDLAGLVVGGEEGAGPGRQPARDRGLRLGAADPGATLEKNENIRDEVNDRNTAFLRRKMAVCKCYKIENSRRLSNCLYPHQKLCKFTV
jgi:hypothetical protein